MDLRHLKYFMTVAETLHFGKAAEKLFMTQPPLSRQIKQLEEELGVPLFHRSKRKVTLTTQGDYLYRESQRIFGHLDSIGRNLTRINEGTVGQINIGYVGAAMHCVLPDLLVRLKSSYPDLNTELWELGNDAQIHALRTGQIDVGFVRMPVKIPGLKAKIVHREKFALVLPAHYRPVTGSREDMRTLADEPFIGFSRECGPSLVDTIFKICNTCGFAPRIVHETSQINSIVRLVESGLGYSIVPVSVRHGYDLKVRFVHLDQFSETAELSMVYAAGELKPIIRNFVAIASS